MAIWKWGRERTSFLSKIQPHSLELWAKGKFLITLPRTGKLWFQYQMRVVFGPNYLNTFRRQGTMDYNYASSTWWEWDSGGGIFWSDVCPWSAHRRWGGGGKWRCRRTGGNATWRPTWLTLDQGRNLIAINNGMMLETMTTENSSAYYSINYPSQWNFSTHPYLFRSHSCWLPWTNMSSWIVDRHSRKVGLSSGK